MEIVRFLKNFKLQVLLVVFLLTIEVVCELSLPSYTSDIVDIGIQQKGISEAIPEQISSNTLENLEIFMNEEEVSKVNSLYTITNNHNYKLKYNDIDNRDTINKIFRDNILALSEYSSNADLGTLKAKVEKNEISSEQITSIKNGIVSSFEKIGDSIIDQKVALFLQNEYETIGVNIDDLQINYLWGKGMKMIVFTLILIFVAIIERLLSSKISADVGRDIRYKLFEKVLSFSNTEMDEFSTASLITRATNDVQQVQQVVFTILYILLYAPIMATGGIIKVCQTASSMGWIIIVAVAFILAIVVFLFKVAMPKFKIMQTLVDKLNLVSREILTGIQVIRAFSREKYEEERFDKANKQLTKTQLFTSRVMSFMFPVMLLIMNVITIMIVWFGSKEIDFGNLQVGNMMAFISYTMQIVMAFMMITMVSIMLPRANVAAKRIEEVLNVEPYIIDKASVLDDEIKEFKGTVKFNDVCFRYKNADEYSLSNINFTASPGKTTAIIGGTGSGKSTLVNLLLRFYDVTKGSITIDNVDIRDLSQHKLRSLEGLVPQKNVLFSGNISENIKFGGDYISDDAMVKAANIAQATEFIEEKPEKYLRHISQGGTNVSGGQKQRLSIARAIAKNPKIFIFDDSFSALDYKTDSMLRKALKNEIKDATVIIVAQRISTILHADQIIVLNDGKIDGIGNHEQLMKDCKTYREIAKSQLSDKELAISSNSNDNGGEENE